MDKSSAVDTIYFYISEILDEDFRHSSSMSEDLSDARNRHLRSDYVKGYSLQEYSNGFYLGDLLNGKRHGYGFYYWYPANKARIADGTLYMGYWRDGEKNGEGFHLKHDGTCYHGEFADGKYHCNHAHVINRNVDFEAAYERGSIKRILYSNSSFDYTDSDGKKVSYDNKTSRLSSGSGSSRSGCLILLVVFILGSILLRMC